MAAKSKPDLVNEGFTEFTIEDFHNTVSSPLLLLFFLSFHPLIRIPPPPKFMDLIELCEKEPSLEKLMDFFNNQNLSDYVVVYLRLLTSGYLQRQHGFFQHFIEGGRSVKEFCQQVGAAPLFAFPSVGVAPPPPTPTHPCRRS